MSESLLPVEPNPPEMSSVGAMGPDLQREIGESQKHKTGIEETSGLIPGKFASAVHDEF